MRMIVVFIVCASLGGCVTGEQITDLRPGMTREQVVKTIGQPDGYRSENGEEILTYTNKIISGWSWDKADYYAILKAGRLTSWGAGTVRQNRPPINAVLVSGAVDIH